jgi:hypothetical protein
MGVCVCVWWVQAQLSESDWIPKIRPSLLLLLLLLLPPPAKDVRTSLVRISKLDSRWRRERFAHLRLRCQRNSFFLSFLGGGGISGAVFFFPQFLGHVAYGSPRSSLTAGALTATEVHSGQEES